MKKITNRISAVIALTSVLLGCGLATSDEDRLARAAEQMESGEYRAAMIQLKNVLGGNADNVEARLMLAKVSLGLGDVLSAEKELARAAELGAQESEIRPLHLQVLAGKGNFTGVLASLGMETSGLSDVQRMSARGEALLALGNHETAAATYRDWLDSEPASSDANVGLARALAMAGDLGAAKDLLTSVVQASPEHVGAWHTLGMVQLRSGNYQLAEDAFLRAVELVRPQADVRKYAAILMGLTESELLLDKKASASRNLDRLMGVAPGSPSTLFLAARLARAEGDIALAARHLQKLLNINRDNVPAQLFLANLKMLQGNFAQAETLLNRVIAVSPQDLQARKLLARVQLQQSQPGGAIEALAPLLETDVDDADLYTILAQANLQQGNAGEAIRRYQQAVELAPNDVETRLNLVSAYLFADEIEVALDVIEDIPAGQSLNYRRERVLMLLLVADERSEEADVIANQLLSSIESPELASMVAADHYFRTGRQELAGDVLRKIVQANPGATDARNALARIEIADGNIDIAEGLLTTVIQSDRVNLVALLELARIAELRGDKEKMVVLLEQAASAHPRALVPRVILIRESLVSNQPDKVERLADELVGIGFSNARIGEIVANVFAQVGRSDEALAQFQKAARLDPQSASIQSGIARVNFALGRTVAARQALDRALEITPGWPPAMTGLALIAVSQGKVEDALRLVEEFKSLHPDNPAAFVLEGEILLYQREFSRSAEAFRRAVGRGAGGKAVLREYQARVSAAMPNPELTLENWLSENDTDTLARKFLAQHYMLNDRGNEAITEYEKLLEYNPNDAVVLNNMAWQYQQKNDLEQAVELAEMAYTIDPESGSIADTLGWIYYDLGQLEKSLELLADASRLSPENGEIKFHLAVALSDSGDSDQARRVLEQLQQSNAQFPSRERADELLGQL